MTLSARLSVVNWSEPVSYFINFLEDGFIVEEGSRHWIRTIFERLTLWNQAVCFVVKTIRGSFTKGWLGAGEVCGDGWFFISSRRKALLAVLWCA